MGLLYKSFRWILAFALIIAVPKESWGYVDPPTFSPEQPVAGQPVDLSVRRGLCHAFVEPPPGVPFMEVQVNGNVIDVIFTGVVATAPFCLWSEVTTTRNIGAFPEGVYTVQIRIRQDSEIPPISPPLSQSILTVGPAPAPHNVPAGGNMAWLLLGFGILAIVLGRSKRIATMFVVPLGLLIYSAPQVVSAHEDGDYLHVIVEISREDGAPSPEEIVDFDFSKGETPPLEGLAVGEPEWANFLISKPFRAQGDFKRYLDNNPDLPMASLENSVVVKYRAGANPEEVLAALSSDPFVRYAVISEKVEVLAGARDQSNRCS